MIGAKLQRVAVAEEIAPKKYLRDSEIFLWQLEPDRYPMLNLVTIDDVSFSGDGEYFGLFRSERMARGALRRLARKKFLCHGSLGIPDTPESPCLACSESARFGGCRTRAQRLRHLTKAFVALKPLRVASWPYSGPIGLRERSDVHIFDRWRYLGTARTHGEVHEVLHGSAGRFDLETFAILSATLGATPSSRIVTLDRGAAREAGDAWDSSA
jgi:DNA polymerase-3 subunit epsilon